MNRSMKHHISRMLKLSFFVFCITLLPVFASIASAQVSTSIYDVVFISNKSGNPEIWKTSYANPSNMVKVSNFAGSLISPSSPSWSPDGQWISFTATPSGGKSQVYVIKSDGSQAAEALTNWPHGVGDSKFGLDSEWVYYRQGVPVTNTMIYRINRITKIIEDVQPDTTKTVQAFDISHDGQYRVEMRENGCCWSPSQSTVLYDLVGGTSTTIMAADNNAEFSPNFSNDNSKIIFSNASGYQSPVNLWVMNRDGSVKWQVTSETGNISYYGAKWLPDGQNVLVTYNNGTREGIYIVDTASGQKQPFLVDANYSYSSPDYRISYSGYLFSLLHEMSVSPRGNAWIADGDSDGAYELVILTNQNKEVRIYSPEYTLKASAAFAENPIALAWGDFDGDGKTELAIGTENVDAGGYIYVGNFVNGSWVQKAKSPLIGSFRYSSELKAADIDGDGHDELLVGVTWYGRYLVAYDIDNNTFTEKYRFNIGSDVNSVDAGDVDGDGKIEYGVGTACWSDYQARIYKDGNLLFNSGSYGAAEVSFGDIDGDGKAEMLAGFGEQCSAGVPSQYFALYKHNGATMQQIFESTPISGGGRYYPKLFDLDGDGKAELIVARHGLLIDEFAAYKYTGAGFDKIFTGPSFSGEWFSNLSAGILGGKRVFVLATSEKVRVYGSTNSPIPCTYTISPTNASFSFSGNTGTVAVTTSLGICSWAAVSNDSWITVKSGNSGTGNGTVRYSVTNSVLTRTGTITIGGQTFTVTQAGVNAYSYFNTVLKFYIGYYQRPADPAGLLYWAGRLDSTGGNLLEIIEAFANSAESKALFGTINSGNISTVVNGIYNALFGRDADSGGLNYYVNGFNTGQFTAATIVLNVLNGAQNEDLQSVNNKLTAANLFTRTIDPELDGINFQVTYAGDGDVIAARNFLALYATSVRVPTQAEITAYIKANIADPGDPIGTSTTVITTNTSLKSNVSVIDSSNSKDIVSTQTAVNGAASINIVANSVFGSSLAAGSVISVLPGSDNRFPLGLSAKVESVITNTDGTKQVALQPATLADVASSTTFKSDPIPLNADNFVGVIAPQATSAAMTVKIAAMLLPQSSKTALNGGIIISNGSSSLARLIDVNGVAKTVQSQTVQGGDVSINLKINLKDMGIDASRMQPYGTSGEAGFEINGSLNNLMLTQDNDFSITSGLKSLDLRATGDIQLETKFTGSGSATLGYYSQAWEEVEDAQIELLGISGKLTGLSSKDKIGEFPVAGLVWSVACPPSGCPVAAGSTQTPLSAAKAGGVILWVYLTAKGEVTVEGSFGARLNPGEFALGVTKTDGGELDTVHELANAGSGRFIEAPFFNGKISMAGRLGTGIDLDFFLFGIRMANASLDLEGRFVEDLTGTISYGTNNLGDPWEWDGNLCFSTSIGAGAVFAASMQVGVEVKTSWGKIDGEFAYSGQWPSESEILLQGWHGIGNRTWYTAAPTNLCYPKPIINTVTTMENLVSRVVTVTVAGTDLPDDLSLTVSPSGSCNNIQAFIITDTQAVYTCTKTSDSSLTYTFKSDKAQNLDVSSATGLIYQPNPTTKPSTPTGFAVTTASSSQINLSWYASTGATGYKIYKYGAYLKAVTTTSSSDTGLSPSTNYCYYVTAYNSAGESLPTSQECATTFGTDPSVPAGMVKIPAGSFQMGDAIEGMSWAMPAHSVTVSAFYLDKYEVTKALWDEVYTWATAHGYLFDNAGMGTAANYPLQYVAWYDVVKWLNARSEKENRTPAYYTDVAQTTSYIYKTGQVDVTNGMVKWTANGYRLPTEAEWEYAARGGTTTRFYTGDCISTDQANYYGDYPETGCAAGQYRGGTTAVGSFPENPWGLHDMVGNIWEWTWDWWDWGYSSSAMTNPKGPDLGSCRVVRGGGWDSSAEFMRSAYRLNYCTWNYAYSRIGFRSALSQP